MAWRHRQGIFNGKQLLQITQITYQRIHLVRNLETEKAKAQDEDFEFLVVVAPLQASPEHLKLEDHLEVLQ